MIQGVTERFRGGASKDPSVTDKPQSGRGGGVRRRERRSAHNGDERPRRVREPCCSERPCLEEKRVGKLPKGRKKANRSCCSQRFSSAGEGTSRRGKGKCMSGNQSGTHTGEGRKREKVGPTRQRGNTADQRSLPQKNARLERKG